MPSAIMAPRAEAVGPSMDAPKLGIAPGRAWLDAATGSLAARPGRLRGPRGCGASSSPVCSTPSVSCGWWWGRPCSPTWRFRCSSTSGRPSPPPRSVSRPVRSSSRPRVPRHRPAGSVRTTLLVHTYLRAETVLGGLTPARTTSQYSFLQLSSTQSRLLAARRHGEPGTSRQQQAPQHHQRDHEAWHPGARETTGT